MAKKFTPIEDLAPRPSKGKEGIFENSTNSNYESKKTTVIEKEAEYNFQIKKVPFEAMEKIKNIAYTEKTKGNVFVTQNTVGLTALLDFLDSYKDEIIERPDAVKEIERNRSKRKNT